MMLRYAALLALVVLLLAPAAADAADAATGFLETNYYLLSLGHLAGDVESIRQAVQSSGYSVITYSGSSIEATRGDGTVPTIAESVLSDERLMVVDNGRFLLRASGEGFAFTVRPSENGYELVIDPQRDLSMADVLGSVLPTLQSIGIVGQEVSLDIQAYAKEALKGPAPPDGVPIDSTLYGLRVARDWFGYAAAKGLTLSGLRVEVVAELAPGVALPAPFAPYAIEQAGDLAKLSLPIEKLVALAGSPEIAYVRPPYVPSVP
jgi:hypothetical protein